VIFALFAITNRDETASSPPAAETLEPEITDARPEVARFPGEGFELAQVRSGEKVEVLNEPGGEVVARLGSRTEFDSPRVLPVLEPGRRWLGVAAPELGNGAVGGFATTPTSWPSATPRSRCASTSPGARWSCATQTR